MFIDPDHCYQALASHDARFDGRFYVGVKTTGIYCRPVCRVRLPRRENCRFYPSAAAAETAGFRPCLRCRPELAPGWASTDIEERLAQAGARMIEVGHLATGNDTREASCRIVDVAARLGITERHFRRVFMKSFGTTPVAYRRTQRLLLAKRLLTDSALPVLDVALAAGFGSARRLNATLKERYGLTPTAMRQGRSRPAIRADGGIALLLKVHEPYDMTALFTALAANAVPGLEAGDATFHRRAVTAACGTKRLSGVIEAAKAQRAGHVMLTVSASLIPMLVSVLSLARCLYDIGADPAAMRPALGALAERQPVLRVPGSASGLETLVRLLVCHERPVEQSRDTLAHLVERYGQPLDVAHKPVLFAFPEPERLLEAGYPGLSACGIGAAPAKAILAACYAVQAGTLELTEHAPVASTLATLQQLPGINDTIVQRMAMHVLRWPDAFPASEPALQQALGVNSGTAAIKLAERWRPWRAYAAMLLLQREPTEPPGKANGEHP